VHKREVYLTFDLDWAKDEQIYFLVDHLIKNEIKATFFLTHYSKAVQKILDQNELFEIGIHPNFLESSTQGRNFEEVIEFFSSWLSRPIGVRTHGLYTSSTYFIKIMKKCPSLQYDVSTYLPYADNIKPYQFEYAGRSIFKIPFNWEDDLEFEVSSPIWSIEGLVKKIDGSIILNLHPFHIFYNNAMISHYEEVKMNKVNINLVERRNNSFGSFSMLNSLIKYKKNIKLGTLSEFI
jgi:hypothetical protein